MIYGFRTPESSEILIAIDDLKILQEPTLITTSDCGSSANPNTSDPLPAYKSTTKYVKPSSESTTSEQTKIIAETESTTALTLVGSSLTSFPTSQPSTAADNKCNGGRIPDDMDFSPCSACILDQTGELEVHCELVNMTEVQNGPFLSLVNLTIGSLYLTVIEGDYIPANFFGSAVNLVHSFFLDCPNSTVPFKVSPLAFGSDTGVTINYLHINCNLFDLGFLFEIRHVYQIQFENMANLHDILVTMPNEFSMDAFQINFCTNLNMIDSQEKLPNLLNGIVTFQLYDNEEVQDETLVVFLGWLSSGKSRNTLKTMNLDKNGFSSLPSTLYLFSQLETFNFNGNPTKPGVIETGSIVLSHSIYLIQIVGCTIQYVEPDAFQGKFTKSVQQKNVF